MSTTHPSLLSPADALPILEERGFIAQCTDLADLRGRLAAGAVTFYIGFDGTADSLHVGHLVSLMSMRWMAACGHRPIALVGGATSMVGDPSFRNTARPVLTKDAVRENIAGITGNIQQVLNSANLNVVNNDDWLSSVGLIDFMRDVGAHFTIARMLSMETVKARLEANEPMTALEFSYMMLQSHDFQQLASKFNCELQMGGSDQWGNIVNGIELARKADGKRLFGLTTPLLATADGTKMGKTAKGAVWLSAAKTSPFDFWQFWRNVDDQDVHRFLLLFSELTTEEIRAVCADQDANGINKAKIILANAVTEIVHGIEHAKAAQAQASALFNGTGDASITEIHLDCNNVPTLLRDLGWVQSLSAARRLIQEGGVRINGGVVTDQNMQLETASEFEITKGKRNRAQVKLIENV